MPTFIFWKIVFDLGIHFWPWILSCSASNISSMIFIMLIYVFVKLKHFELFLLQFALGQMTFWLD